MKKQLKTIILFCIFLLFIISQNHYIAQIADTHFVNDQTDVSANVKEQTDASNSQLNYQESSKVIVDTDKQLYRNKKNQHNFTFNTNIEEYQIHKTDNSPPDVEQASSEMAKISTYQTEIKALLGQKPLKEEESDTNNKLLTPEDEIEVVYKGSIILNNQTILYVGSTDKIELIKRLLDIQASIKDAIYTAARAKNYSLETFVKPYNEDYILNLNDQTVLRVTDIDAEINNVNKERLSEIWKYNIDNLIKNTVRKIHIETEQEILKKIIFYILIGFSIILFIELIIVKTKTHIQNLIKIAMNKLQQSFYQMRIKSDTSSFRPNEELIRTQIDNIGHQTGTIFDIISRILQLVTFFTSGIIILYNIPETYTYINQFAHYLISYTTVTIYTLNQWSTSKETWSSFITVLFYIAEATVIIYVVKIIASICKNIIHILLAGNIVKIKRFETICLIISNTIQILIIVIVLFLMLVKLGINLAPILAGAGIAGIAISFGAQNLIKDIINGLFILTENQFGIGDVIKIGDCFGVVEDMTLRITLIRDLSAVAHIIPNGQISQVSVYTKNWSRAHLDIGIAYKEDINTAIKLIKETADDMYNEFPDIIISEPRVLGVNALNDSSVDIKIIMDTAAGEQWGIEREFRRRIKYTFDQNNVEIPFPHTTVYMPQNIGYAKEDVETKTADSYVENDFKTYDGKLEKEVFKNTDKDA